MQLSTVIGGDKRHRKVQFAPRERRKSCELFDTYTFRDLFSTPVSNWNLSVQASPLALMKNVVKFSQKLR